VLNKVPVYFWLNFKLKREQEIAVESISINQDILTSHVADCIWEELKYYKCMSFQAGNKTSQLQAFLAFELPIYQHQQRPDCQLSKITWNQVHDS